MKSVTPLNTVFFDLGATLVDPQFTPAGAFSGFTELPGTREGLQKLSAAKLHLGIISNTGDIDPRAVRAALTKIKLLTFFTDKLILLSGEVHLDKSTPAIFRLAVKRAGAEAAPGSCIFVGEDPAERLTARKAKLHTSSTLAALLKTVGTKKPVGLTKRSKLQ